MGRDLNHSPIQPSKYQSVIMAAHAEIYYGLPGRSSKMPLRGDQDGNQSSLLISAASFFQEVLDVAIWFRAAFSGPVGGQMTIG